MIRPLLLLCLLAVAACHRSNQDLKITFVTGLWNVNRGDMLLFKRTFDYYLSYFKDFVQSKNNMIIFGNAEVKQFVEKNKIYKDNIFFIETDLKDIEKYWYTEKIGQVIDQTKKSWIKWQRYSVLPQYGLRMYNPVVMSKLKFILDASKADPFNSDYLVWIDSAITHAMHPSILNGTFDKLIRNFQIDWFVQTGSDLPFHPFQVGFKDDGRSYVDITTKKRYFVWGNWVGGKAIAASTAYHIFQNFLRFTLEKGEMNTDEALFFMMLERYSYFFHRIVDIDTIDMQSNSLINLPIVEEKYSLRQIRASDVISFSELRANDDQTCAEPLQFQIKYTIQTNQQFLLTSDSFQRTLKVRVAFASIAVIMLALLKWKNRQNSKIQR